METEEAIWPCLRWLIQPAVNMSLMISLSWALDCKVFASSANNEGNEQHGIKKSDTFDF